jgi:hypothetical protein
MLLITALAALALLVLAEAVWHETATGLGK